jgi:hypothetical protein
MKNIITSQKNIHPYIPLRKYCPQKRTLLNKTMEDIYPPCEVVKFYLFHSAAMKNNFTEALRSFANFWLAGYERKLPDPQAGTCFPAQKSALLSTRHIHKPILQGKIGHRCRNVTTFMTPRTLSGPCQSLSDMTEKSGFLAHFLR